MFQKIKDILGLEGVEIELKVPDSIHESMDNLTGVLLLRSQSDKHVHGVNVRLIEKYRRGRDESALINDYLLGEIQLELDMHIHKDEEREIEFHLPFNFLKSDIDKLADSNLISRPFIKLAKWLKNVKSDYRIEATAYVTGIKLNPIVVEKIEIEKA